MTFKVFLLGIEGGCAQRGEPPLLLSSQIALLRHWHSFGALTSIPEARGIFSDTTLSHKVPCHSSSAADSDSQQAPLCTDGFCLTEKHLMPALILMCLLLTVSLSLQMNLSELTLLWIRSKPHHFSSSLLAAGCESAPLWHCKLNFFWHLADTCGRKCWNESNKPWFSTHWALC